MQPINILSFLHPCSSLPNPYHVHVFIVHIIKSWNQQASIFLQQKLKVMDLEERHKIIDIICACDFEMMSYLYLFTITPYYNISDLIWIWKPEWTMLKWSFNMFNIQCHTLQLVIVCHVLVVQLPIITNHQAESIVHLSYLGVPVFVPSIFHKHLCVSSFYHCSLSPFIQHTSPTVSVLSLCHSKLNFRYHTPPSCYSLCDVSNIFPFYFFAPVCNVFLSLCLAMWHNHLLSWYILRTTLIHCTLGPH